MAWRQIGQNRATQWDPPEDPVATKATKATFRYWNQRDRVKWFIPIAGALGLGHWLPFNLWLIATVAAVALVIFCAIDAFLCYRISKRFSEDRERGYRVIDPDEPQPTLEEGEIGL